MQMRTKKEKFKKEYPHYLIHDIEIALENWIKIYSNKPFLRSIGYGMGVKELFKPKLVYYGEGNAYYIRGVTPQGGPVFGVLALRVGYISNVFEKWYWSNADENYINSPDNFDEHFLIPKKNSRYCHEWVLSGGSIRNGFGCSQREIDNPYCLSASYFGSEQEEFWNRAFVLIKDPHVKHEFPIAKKEVLKIILLFKNFRTPFEIISILLYFSSPFIIRN
jgi:hypothetical protein